MTGGTETKNIVTNENLIARNENRRKKEFQKKLKDQLDDEEARRNDLNNPANPLNPFGFFGTES